MACYHPISTSKGENIMELENASFPKIGNGSDGVYLTWKDICVTVYDRATGNSKSILEDVTGYACPGQVLAIMGPSGCGKSTLLDALAGRLDLSVKQSGKLLVNGCKQRLSCGISAYVTQDNILMETLTVRETMYYSSELLLPSSMLKFEKRKRAEECIKEMGLQDAIDTRVGGWSIKGLSGGEKKRLSLCIELLSPSKVLFLDEPTTGLDTAASFYVMSRIVTNERTIGRTIIASIHQPCSQVFALLDNLCLMSAGRTIYFGAARDANKFFTSNGFPCPSFQNPSDHFLQMINKDFDEVIIEHGLSNRKSTKLIVDSLAKSYNTSENYQNVLGMIDAILCEQKRKTRLESGRTIASFFIQCNVLTRRSFINMSRDWGYYWLRLIIYIILGLGIGHLFFDLGNGFGSIQARVTVFMFVVSYLTVLSIGGFLSLIEEMKVFKRERLNGHYSTTSYIIGHTLSSMPFVLLVSLLPGAITYYLPGFQGQYENFVYFVLVLFASILLVESLLMIVATLVPNFLLGLITGGGIQGLMVLSAGFIRLPNDLPGPFWRYPFYYISFHRYAYQGLLKNEFEGLKFPIILGTSSNMISGDSILKTLLQVEEKYSKWINLAILVGMVIFYRLLFLIIITTSDQLKPLIRASIDWKITKASISYYAQKRS